MYATFLLFAFGFVAARPAMEVSPATPSPSSWQDFSQGEWHAESGYWNHQAEAVEITQPSGSASASASASAADCRRAFKAIKRTLNSKVPKNKLLPWQPAIPAWWKMNQDDLLQQIIIVHDVASDDFDDYVMWVADHPDVPDDQKHPSYLAAQRILDVVRAAKIDGPWGAFHLVTRVSKWLLLNPKPVNRWKKACFDEESTD